MKIGSIIRAIRESKGLSQKDVISTIDMGAAMYSRIELNKSEPSLSTLERISKALGISLFELFKTDDTLNDINSIDKSLMEKVRLMDSLTKEEKKIIFSILDAFVSKKRMKDALTNALNDEPK